VIFNFIVIVRRFAILQDCKNSVSNSYFQELLIPPDKIHPSNFSKNSTVKSGQRAWDLPIVKL
jgi:hypothetical protein